MNERQMLQDAETMAMYDPPLYLCLEILECTRGELVA